MRECPIHCGWFHPWSRGPGFYNEAGWASYREQVSKQNPSLTSASAPASRITPVWAPIPTSFNDEQGCGSVSWINPFLPKFLWSWCLFVNTLGSIRFKLKCIPTLDAILPQIHKAKSVQSPSPKSTLGWEPSPLLPIKLVCLPFCEEQKNLGSAIERKAS